MPPSQLVYALEIRMAQQPRIARESGADSRLNHSFRFSGNTGGHSDSKFQIAAVHNNVKAKSQQKGTRTPVRAPGLFAEAWFYRDPFTPLGAAAG